MADTQQANKEAPAVPAPDFEAVMLASKEKAREATERAILKDAKGGKTKTPPKAAETKDEPEETEEETEEEDETSEEESEEEDEDSREGHAELKKNLKGLFKKWDLNGIEDALGMDRGTLNKDKNFARLRIHQNQLDESLSKLEKGKEEFEATRKHNEEVLVKKYGGRVQMDQAAANGDIKTYCEIIKRDWNCSVDTFVRAYTKNIASVSVREKDLEKKLTETEARLKKLESGGGTEEETETEDSVTADEVKREKAVKNVKNYLKEALEGTDALQVKNGLDIAFDIYIANFDPKKKACKLSPEAIAKEVLKEKRRQLEEDDWVKTGKKPKKKVISRTISRQEANVSQPRKKNMTKEEAMDVFVKNMARQKAAS